MRKTKYYYNKETCSYEVVRPSRKELLFKYLRFLIIVIISSFLMISLYDKYFESPVIISLKKENQELKTHFDILNEEIELNNKMLSNLQERDDDVYRIIFEAQPIPSSIRKAGVGGIEKYKDLIEGSLEREDIILETYKKSDELKRKMYIQTKSYDELIELANNKEKLLASIPAIQPVSNKNLKRISSGFGRRIDPYLKVKRMHWGIDFSLEKGNDIYATADGVVKRVKSSFGGLGKHIYIDHGNGFMTIYGHLDEYLVKRGQKVKRGELIAYSGNSGRSTAPHLHYEISKNGKKVNPVHYFFNELSPSEYEEVLRLSSIENQALGSTF